MRIDLSVAILIYACSCNGLSRPNEKHFNDPRDSLVSIIRLISMGKHYDGYVVQVRGYLHIEFEGNALFLTEEHFVHGLRKNAIWVDFPESMTGHMEHLSGEYVTITGVYKVTAGGHGGHMGLYSGEISINSSNDVDAVK